ncbi:anti-anti-sigma factor [Azospirillum sp. TSH58]|uniref:STAS domain-containing protein n=1 Tax=Azospirillum sp. TSH58 TaxID=664962 RepID=UPI000D600C66|nr:STAS domain-containing protein [Azospirillum sp. TSH58]AWJ83772.1 anti-anti-sigma factor [Azospirillum sp. TSH58]MCR6630266.1 STAS domain-containing protein [Magnetospirillum sp.]PWC62727.1 anti-anti-sigma factor [Azospirillum sp. TSH58]
MNFQVRRSSETIEVLLSGRLEFTDHDSLPDIVELLNGEGARRFVLDMDGLTFIDSAGIGMLLILQDESEQRNIKLVLRKLQGDVLRSIDLARIGEVVTIER